MKASFSWLKEYVAIEMSASDLADALTMAGLEVDALTDRYDYLKSVLVGQIVGVYPHPNADKLKLCKVSTGNRTVSVVCGAPNAEKGMLSALALPGTMLPDGTEVGKSTIRGQISEGMLCSEGELGLGEDRSGIVELPSDKRVGGTLSEALALTDPVLEVDLTPNRPDCLSIIGIAREIAAIEKKKLRYPELNLPPGVNDIHRYTSVTIDDPEHCPRYAACLLTDIAVAPSPFWLQDRLNSVGLRPINNIVDVTNYVMMETGQPLHAFDFDRLSENRIVVRTAKAGERFTTLDEKDRLLSSHMLMICDGRKPVAVGGVMGGMNSEIELSTTRVLIESAYFNPASIRRTSKRLGLGTDASHRFERGVDPEGTLFALKRAAQLMTDVGGGILIEGIIDEYPLKKAPKTIYLNTDQTNRFLGTNLTPDTMIDLLTSIEFNIQKQDDHTLVTVPPSFRVDIGRPVDLMEEIARLSGYNEIPTTFPAISGGTRLSSWELDLRDHIRRLMAGLGFTEAITYSFMNRASCDKLRLPPEDPRRCLVEILNPITEDQTVMRTSVVPGLLEVMRRNITQQVRNLKLFEIGKVFIDKHREELPDEIEMLVGLWTGARRAASWHSEEANCDFYDIKGAVEGLFSGLKLFDCRFKKLPAEACHYLRPGHTAEISIQDTDVGSIGEIRSEVLSDFALKQAAFIFELNLNRIFPLVSEVYQVKTLSRFPATSRDLTMIVDRQIESGSILDRFRRFDEELVENIHFLSVFEGDPIPAGRKSVSFRITYRSDKETLQDEMINRLHKDISDRLIKVFNASLPAST